MGFKPLSRRVLIRDLPETTSSNIVLLEGTYTSNNRKSLVHALGEGVTEVEVGDTVLTEKFYGRKVELDGIEYREYPVDQILLVYK